MDRYVIDIVSVLISISAELIRKLRKLSLWGLVIMMIFVVVIVELFMSHKESLDQAQCIVGIDAKEA